MNPFDTRSSCIPKMSLLIDPYSNKLLLVWQKPCLLNIANLLEVC